MTILLPTVYYTAYCMSPFGLLMVMDGGVDPLPSLPTPSPSPSSKGELGISVVEFFLLASSSSVVMSLSLNDATVCIYR